MNKTENKIDNVLVFLSCSQLKEEELKQNKYMQVLTLVEELLKTIEI